MNLDKYGDVVENNEDGFLFEIDDTAYLLAQLGYLYLGLFILLFVGTVSDGWGHGDYRLVFATLAASLLILKQTVILINYYLKRDKKIKFYKEKIVRTNRNIIVEHNKIHEGYVFCLNVNVGVVKRTSSSMMFFYISLIITGPLIVPPFMFAAFTLGLIHSRYTIIINNLALIKDDEVSSISIPLSVVGHKEYSLITNYLRDFLKIEIREIERKFMKVPNQVQKNLNVRGVKDE